MLMKRILCLSALFSLFLVGCEREIDGPEDVIQGDKVYKVTMEPVAETKTALSEDNRVIWGEGDRLMVFEGIASGAQYEVNPESVGQSSGSFTFVKNIENEDASGAALGHNVAFYPFDKSLLCEAVTGGSYILEEVELPQTQQYARNSFGPESFPMVAVGNIGSKDLAFRNICGAVMLQIKGDVTVKSISLKGNDGEALSGKAVVRAYADGTAPLIEMEDDALLGVMLDCGDGVGLGAVATEFIIAVPPVEFSKGFTALITATDGRSMEFRTDKANVVPRSTVLKMPEIVFEDGNRTFQPVYINDPGIAYVWDESVIPEITIHITKDEWNRLLKRYDEFSHNVDYFHADFTYKKGDEAHFIEDGGVRLRGNTSRRRPEGNGGEMHNSSNPDWHHCHFGINFRKYHKDSDHTINGIRKVNLKWFKDDPCYVRELYCYDLFRRYGIWTAAHDVYCRLWLDVEGDAEPAYYGVYEMIEPIDDEFVERRVDGMFKSDKGFLWKCVYGVSGPADLRTDGDNAAPYSKMNWDQDNGINYTYEFKGDEEDFEAAKIQLGDFMQKLNGKGEESFYKWINEVCNVELLLKTYAVNVALGMWDDMWNNGNNYYLYFNTTDQYDYEVFFLPYDYDNTLGTSSNCGVQSDAGRQDPYNWGDSGLLMERMMKFDDFRQIYRDALKELVDPANALFHMDASVPRIKAWQQKISPYISNDTDEDMSVYDQPAHWGNHHEYRLMDTGSNNFFKVKTQTINNMK